MKLEFPIVIGRLKEISSLIAIELPTVIELSVCADRFNFDIRFGTYNSITLLSSAENRVTKLRNLEIWRTQK
jgi:hypothetical protein